MSQKKLLIGLPVALLLGGSAIGFGVLPGVRDWVDQTVPWLGINGVKLSTNSNQANQSNLKPVVEDNSSPTFPVAQFDISTLSSLPSAPQYDVQTAQATLPIPTKGASQTVGEMPYITTARLVQAPTIGAVPPAGIPVPSSVNGTIIVNDANVYFHDEGMVAAQADGIIMKMFVDDGNMVKTDSPLLEIDVRTVAAEVEMAMKEMEAADLKAKNESSLDYSRKAFELAKNEEESSEKLLAQSAEDFSAFAKKRLEREKAFFQIKMSETDKATNAAEHAVKKAKFAATLIQMELRKILAQRTGMVTEVTKRQGDWVRAGEPILRLTALDKIRIKGIAQVYDAPHLLLNAPARVIINFAPGKSESIDGIVTFVSPRTTAPGKYQIYVDLPNQLTPDGQYLFREGMTATIEVAPRTR